MMDDDGWYFFIFLGHTLGMFGTFVGHVWEIFWTCLEYVWDVFGTCFGGYNFPEKKLTKTLNSHLGSANQLNTFSSSSSSSPSSSS